MKRCCPRSPADYFRGLQGATHEVRSASELLRDQLGPDPRVDRGDGEGPVGQSLVRRPFSPTGLGRPGESQPRTGAGNGVRGLHAHRRGGRHDHQAAARSSRAGQPLPQSRAAGEDGGDARPGLRGAIHPVARRRLVRPRARRLRVGRIPDDEGAVGPPGGIVRTDSQAVHGGWARYPPRPVLPSGAGPALTAVLPGAARADPGRWHR